MADLTRHPDVVDLAEYAEGVLDPDRRSAVDHHVRGCLDCARTLSDLGELPDALAQAPVPPMPADVADRLDRAVAAESTARASLWDGAAKAEVTPLRSRRRWLGPVVAAAAVLGVIGIAVPALDNAGNDDSAGESAATGESSADQDLRSEPGDTSGAAPELEDGAGAVPPADLSSDHFGQDVLETFYNGSAALRLDRKMETLSVPGADAYRESVEAIPDLCSADEQPSVPNGQVDAVTYDGADAELLRLEVGRTVEAIAFRCDAGEPIVLDAVTLRPGS
jgi:hypothetical protein